MKKSSYLWGRGNKNNNNKMAHFRMMKLKRATDESRVCIDAINTVKFSVDGILSSMERLKEVSKVEDRAKEEQNCADREKWAQINDFNRRIHDQEIVTVQRTVQKYNKQAMHIEELEQLRKRRKGETTEEQENHKKEMDDLFKSTYEVELSFENATHSSTNLQVHLDTLKSQIGYLEQSIASLKGEYADARKLTLDVSLNSIHSHQKKRPRGAGW